MRQLIITKKVTNRANDGLDKYLYDISKVPMITAEEEVSLAVRIKTGDHEALNRLVNGNLRFVVSVAKQYQNQGISLGDLINEGNLGLIKAATRFDETKGFKFISFAVWWIRQCIMLSLAEQGRIVRLPLNIIGINNKIISARQIFEQQYEREPTEEELAEILDMELDDVKMLLSSTLRSVSMDSPIQEGEEGSLVDTMINPNAESADKKIEHFESLQKEIQHALLYLTDIQKKIICYFYGIGVDHCLSLDDIAEKFDLSSERVRQIKAKAIFIIKNTQSCKELKYYLGS